MTAGASVAAPPLSRGPGPAPPQNPRPAPRRDPRLALVAIGYAAFQLALVVPDLGLGWDETVYVSQVDPRNPAAWFSAPRSRGISLLTEPFVAVTDSTTVLRIVLALLSAAALYAAFKVWQPLFAEGGAGRVALAALLFGGLWISVLSGSQAMPNLWLALASVAAVGWFLRAVAPGAPRRTGVRTGLRAGVGLAACVAAATLFRAPDGAWLALPLLAGCLVVRSWRRRAPVIAIVTGLAAGSAEWIVEAYARWGGIGARLHISSATEGGMGAHWAGGYALRSLNGPLLCRPCDVSFTHPVLTLWWLTLPALALAACGAALRSRRPGTTPTTLLPVACAASLAVPYLFLIDYSAPRFLLPAYALLALPIADLTFRTVNVLRSARGRTVATTLLAVLFALHLAAQEEVLRHNVHHARTAADRHRTAARELNRLGLRPPCLVTGKHALPIAYYARCSSAETSGNNRSTTKAALLRRATREPTAVLVRNVKQPPRVARTWTAHHLRGTGWTAYLKVR